MTPWTLQSRVAELERERDEALSALKRMEECDCVPVIISSRSCPKCGRRGVAFDSWLERAETAERDLAQARQALEDAHDELDQLGVSRSSFGGPFGDIKYEERTLNLVGRIHILAAREALVERGTEQDSGGARGAHAEKRRYGDCTNGPDEEGNWLCDPKVIFGGGQAECQACGRVAEWPFDGSQNELCECGHAALWHAPDGSCEHNGECKCSGWQPDSGADPNPGSPVSLSVQEGQGEALGAIRDGRAQEGSDA